MPQNVLPFKDAGRMLFVAPAVISQVGALVLAGYES